MSDVVNLNRARKKKRAAATAKAAEENRVKFGRTKAERRAAKTEREARGRALDGAELDKTE